MPNILQNLAKSSSARRRGILSAAVLALACSLFPVPCSLLYADSTVWNAVEAGHLTWSNATTNWLANGDLVITYKTGNGSLHLPGFAKVWALAVGGGGAGGAGCVTIGNYHGGAGGGGAGGYVENNSLILAGDDYDIVAGAGGQPKSNEAYAKGNNGEDSSFKCAGNAIEGFPDAKGGGGGGAESAGAQGGCGGGGSQKRASASLGTGYSGGTSTQSEPGLGSAGGKSGSGNSNKYKLIGGGGGGGAGGVGTSTTAAGGNGGNGMNSSITGSDVWYAGGGGGAVIDTAALGLESGAGGQGGGGHGGDGTSETQLLVNGEDGKGGGGGGSSVAGPAGKGGDGVVIVRISLVVDGPIEKPQYKEVNYTGNEITIIDSIPGVYKVTGDYKKTNVSDTPYEYTVTLEPGFKWSDGTDDPVTQTWKILPGLLTMPAPTPAEIVYDETNHVVVTASPNYEFLNIGTGNNATNATNVGDYRYEVKLTDEINWRWADGSTTNLVYNWSILPRPVPQQVLPTGLVFGYTNVVAVTNNEHFYTFTPDSVTNSAHAGTYKITYVLTDPANNCWADGSVTNQTYYWTIARLPIARPPIPGDTEPGKFVYNGSEREIATNSIYWMRTSIYQATDAGEYTAVLKLNGDWCWKPGPDEEDTSIADYVIDWEILQAPNEITSLRLADWKLGETPKTPSCEARFGANTAIYEYGKNPSGYEWSPTPPETNGVFYVRATIPATENWKDAQRSKRFLIYKSFEELYTDFVDIEFPNYKGEGRDNAVVLIKISEDIFKGFSYDRCDGGDKLAFMDFTEGQSNSPLSFEVDTWKDKNGESLVWVKIPRLESREGYAKTKIRMYWHLREGMEAPGESPEDVWSDYAGVWHFAEEIGTTGADTAISPDSSGHGYDAIPAKGSSGNLSNMVSDDGMIGLARKNASGNYATGGNRFAITNFENCSTLGTNFIFSGWVYFSDYGTTHAPWIIGRKGSNEEDGWALALNASARKKFDIYGVATNQFTTSATVTTYDMKQHWEYVTLAVSGSQYWLYTRSKDNGNNVAQGTLTSPVGGGQTALAFGSSNDGMKPSANAKFDEFRLRPWNVRFDGEGAVVTEDLEALKDEVNFEFYSITNIDHAETHGWVSKDGVLQNYWTRLPSISKTSWEKTDPPATVDVGEAAIGTPFYVVERLFSEGLFETNSLPVEPGKYSITFYVEEEGFNTLKEVKTFSILGHSDYNVIGQTEEGRILLANDDSMSDWGDLSVTNQAYWMTHFVDYHCQSSVVKRVIDHGKWVYQTNWYPYIVTTTNSTYWTHGGDTLSSSSIRPFLQPETTHTLETTNKIDSLCGGSVLWRLENVRIGNLWTANYSMDPAKNYFPWSPTSCAISSNGAVFAQSEVSHMILRNTTGAQIFSACYTNGIGTIYFDAVNAYKSANFPAADAHLIVEVATCVTNEFGEVLYDSSGQKLLPTDENVIDCGWRTNLVWSEDGSTCTTNIDWYSNETYCARAKWEPKAATMIRYLGGAVTKYSPSETIAPYISSSTGTTNDFYRIYVPVNVREPARFRIRRSTKCAAQLIDQNAYILLDNLIVSKPPMRADMESLGTIDMTKKGPNVLGFECATSLPYPAATDEDIYGRARAYYQTSGDGSVDPSAFVKGVTLHYRWRYLNQTPQPGWTNWKTVEMRSKGGLIEAYEPFEHPLAEGDIEYYYETSLQAPYYSYVDYSGSGHGMLGADGKPLYTEEIQTVVNRFGDTDAFRELGVANLPSLGTDWFFRLRNGHDLHGSAALCVTEGPLVGEYPMYLAEDNVWRCLLPLPKTTMVRDETAREGWREVSTDGQPCKFYFAIYDEQTPGALTLEKNTVYLHPVDEMKAIPAKGKVTAGRVPREFTIDLAATHLEWRLNNEFETFAVTRAEYQDFNDWSDAHSPRAGGGQDFYACYSETNGVNLGQIKPYPAPIADWTLYVNTDSKWEEKFDLTAYGGDEEDYGFPREEVFPTHETPNLWGGSYMAFVQQSLGDAALTKVGNIYHKYPRGSGMAGKLLGQGKGALTYDYDYDTCPDGLEDIVFKARVGQSIEAETDFAYSQTSMWDSNYMFSSLASMSHLVTDNNALCDMAAGASLSLIAYYRPTVGLYEFRIERIERAAMTMMSIWKWHLVNGKMKADCLCKRRMGLAMWTNNSAWKQGETSNNNRTADNATIGDRGPQNPQYHLMFISVENTGTSTKIYGGISFDVQLPYKVNATGVQEENNFNAMGKCYTGVYYEDTANDRLQYGAYGVAAKDCPAEFLRPKHSAPVPPVNNSTTPKQGLPLVAHPTANNDWEFVVGREDPKAQYFYGNNNNGTNGRDIGWPQGSDAEDWGDIEFGDPVVKSKWTLPLNRIESFYNPWKTGMQYTHHGLRMPQGLEQNVIVQVSEKTHKNDWKDVATCKVKGYGFADYRIPFFRKDKYNVRFTTGPDAIDVVLDDIVQRQWMGEDILNITGKSKDFVYTQGHVVTNTTAKRIEIELVPARAHADRALSVRSPVIDGVGKISFEYAGAQPTTEIWVQMATNNVLNNLTGANGYNDSIRSVEEGQQQEVGEWITLAKYTYTNTKQEFALGPSGTKTVYVGLHDQKPDRRIQGAFRLFIPPAKVEYTDTRTSEQLDAGDKDYGRITVTGMTVWDEPGLDERSWRGWNLRTVGDDQDSEKRMYLCDMTLVGKEGEDKSGYGLVGALNNSINNVPGEAPEKVRTGYPAIWSPTLGSYTNEYGQATKACVGEVTFKARVYENSKRLKGGKVTIYGASHSVIGKWTKIIDFEITQPYLQNFSWKAGGEEYAAIRFEVTDPSAKTTTAVYDRVVIDEITITERVAPTLAFSYAWPFRDGLNGLEPVANIGTREQQPLAGENWGVQTKLTLQQLGDDVDIDRGLEIYLSYFDEKPTESNWGYENWKDRKTGEVKLVQVGDASNLVFRSVSAVPESVMAPSADAGTVVQFMLRVKYYDKGGYEYWDQMHTWAPPSWYDPVDYNASLGSKSGGFAAFTILDTISPGRAWINEVQWNNGNRNVTHTTTKVTDNQFVEVCIPSGVDMTGWWLRVYDMNAKEWTMAKFGKNGVEASKTSGDAVNGYEFFVLMSPETDSKGGFVGPGGIGVRADGVWSGDSLTGGGVKNGTLAYAEPFCFELVRPSGVIEHTFVLGGTNEWGAGYGDYEPEGLLNKLRTKAPDGAGLRFVAGSELCKNDNGGTYATRGTTYGSSGVVGEQGTGGGPGSMGTWMDGLDFTAGRLNPGQVIPEGWFLAPNGTNTWVYFSVEGGHIAQRIGGSTNRTELVILPQGQSTNVTYTAAPWWETATIAVDGVTNAVHAPGTFDYHFSVPEGAGTMVRVVATEGVDARLDDDKFKLKGQRYRNAVLNWLGENWPDRSPDDIRFARMAQLNTPVATHAMTLIDMYWLDICPFNSEGSAFEPTPEMDPLSSEWVLRAGFTDYKPNAIYRHKNWGTLTNSVFKVKMYVTNEFTHAAYAPYTLQGIGNERSCDYTGNWTSETFKINGFLDVNRDGGFNKGFLPFREFVFNRGSFAPAGTGAGTPVVPGDELDEGVTAGTPGDFEAVIELLDPFSSASTAGASYGWWRWPNNTPAFFSWRINHTNSFIAVEQLLPQSAYGE